MFNRSFGEGLSSPSPPPSERGGSWTRSVWTVSECIEEICSCCYEFWSTDKNLNIGSFAFDKVCLTCRVDTY